MLKEILDRIDYSVMSHDEFNMYPEISDRVAWGKISHAVRSEIISEAEKYLDYQYPMLPITVYMRFVKDGNRTQYQELYNKRRRVLGSVLMAECIENKGRFINTILDGIYCICEETTWVLPAHNCKDRYYGNDFSALPLCNNGLIDLYSSSTAKLLAMSYYLMKSVLDDISPEIGEMIERKINSRILKPYMSVTDSFWMRETNNWNVHVNYYCFITFILMAKEEEQRLAFMKKFAASVDIYLEAYNNDGGCDEGPEYWSGSGGNLFRIAELLKYVTYGKCNLFEVEKVRNIGQYPAKVNIYDTVFPSISDGAAVVLCDFSCVYGFGKAIGDTALMKLAQLMEKKRHIYHETEAVLLLDEVRAFNGEEKKLKM